MKQRLRFCPDCQQRGALQGIAGSTWMECPDGHSWGYEESGDST